MIKQSPPAARRRGFGLVELAVAGILFATMAVLAVQLIGWVALDRQAVGRREAATRVVSNLTERILLRPWAAITTEALAPLAAELGGSKALHNGRLRVEVIPGPAVDGRGAKKIVVEVDWPDRVQVAEAPVRLISWTFERTGGQP